MNIKIKKAELLTVVKNNREKHREIVVEAFAKYREMAIKEIDSMLSEAKSGKRIKRYVDLTEPVDQTKEYDKAIRQIEMSAEENIELADREFDCLILDNWSWKAQFSAANSAYSAKAELN